MKKKIEHPQVPGWYIEFQASLLRQAPRPEQLDQKTAEEWNKNQKALKELMTQILLPSKPTVFKLLKSFLFTIPKDYDHSTQLATFQQYIVTKYKMYYEMNHAMNTKNFAGATNKLIPGKTYRIDFWEINQKITSEDCLTYLKLQNAILVGAHGMSLLWQYMNEVIPMDKIILSFDEKEALWKDTNNQYRVPSMHVRRADGLWRLGLKYFYEEWDNRYCLLCFCKI